MVSFNNGCCIDLYSGIKGLHDSMIGKILLVVAVMVLMLALPVQAISKNGIDVTLIDNTYYCDENCYSVYRVCYQNSHKLDKDFEPKFNKEDKYNKKIIKNLNKNDYLVDFVITDTNVSNCKELRVNGKKEKFESIDNVPCIDGTCFDEYAWWHSSWNNAFLMENLTASNIPDGYQIEFTFTDSDIPYSFFAEPDFIDMRITNGSHPYNDSGIEIPFFIELDCTTTNITHPCTIYIKSTENMTSFIMWLNASGVSTATNGKNTFDVFDNFNDNSINTSVWIEYDTNNRISETNNRLQTIDETDGWVSYLTTVQNFTYPYIFESEHRRIDGSGGKYAWSLCVMNEFPITFATCDHAIFGISDSSPVYNVFENGASVYSGSSTAINVWYKMKVELNATSSRYYLDGNLEYVGSSPNATEKSITVVQFNDGIQHYDNFRIRKLIDNPPTWNITPFIAPPLPPPVIPPNATTNKTYVFDSTQAFYVGRCISDDILLIEWNTTGSYEAQFLTCTNGCVSGLDAHGDVCMFPDYVIYGILILVTLFIILVMYYFTKRK